MGHRGARQVTGKSRKLSIIDRSSQEPLQPCSNGLMAVLVQFADETLNCACYLGGCPQLLCVFQIDIREVNFGAKHLHRVARRSVTC